MLYLLKIHAELLFRRYLKDERGEGMVGWIVGALLTVTIVTILHGAITGWLGDFWADVEANIEKITETGAGG
ncbi:hypothetical protein Tfer_2283 [Thermincola ferriacetica]|uniref:Uncharacterized protein n=2 Tax=Thermincola TaxID=278993 RepID=D5XCQ1_THEPJ|nr:MULTISPECIES: hypothetical protein [Thermincola]ADG81677.1 hypothetical protein TherJR_0810 [Thermincola potens JR]KNZ69039.1 hypothetical protein Tfer_2283 [Thermincola ferriacetica]